MSDYAKLIQQQTEMLEALKDAEAGLVFAGADKTIQEGAFVPTPTLALVKVREVMQKVMNDSFLEVLNQPTPNE